MLKRSFYSERRKMEKKMSDVKNQSDVEKMNEKLTEAMKNQIRNEVKIALEEQNAEEKKIKIKKCRRRCRERCKKPTQKNEDFFDYNLCKYKEDSMQYKTAIEELFDKYPRMFSENILNLILGAFDKDSLTIFDVIKISTLLKFDVFKNYAYSNDTASVYEKEIEMFLIFILYDKTLKTSIEKIKTNIFKLLKLKLDIDQAEDDQSQCTDHLWLNDCI